MAHWDAKYIEGSVSPGIPGRNEFGGSLRGLNGQKVYVECSRPQKPSGALIAAKEVEEMVDIMDQLIAIVVLGALTFVLPAVLNKWSDSRAGVR